MKLFLTRHGETEWNRLRKTQGTNDIGLTDLGRIQAKKLGKRLKEMNIIDAIYCSDLSRARETAEIIGAELKIEPIADKLLREVSFGNWEGLTTAEIEIKYPGQLARWRCELSFSPKGGESLLSVHNRISRFFEKLKEKHQDHDSNVLIVSHAATTKVIMLSIMGIPLNLLTRFKISQAGLSLIEVGKESNSLIYTNDTCHLKP